MEAGDILVDIQTKQTLISDDLSRLLDYNEGSWRIISNQMIYYKRDGSELMRFDLKDSSGQPITRGAVQRIKVI